MEGNARIAVIGGGASGVLTAIHALWRMRPGERLYLVERGGELCRGVAYATRDPGHLLNVRSERMSAFDDEPDHFLRWLDRQPTDGSPLGERTIAGTFIRRDVYGRYLQELLHDAVMRQGGAQNFYLINDSAVALEPVSGGWRLGTGLGRGYGVDAAVLAFGNSPGSAPPIVPGAVRAWEPAALAGLHPDRPILIVGTGLTTIDQILTLLAGGFKAPIYALSRHGILPHSHALCPVFEDFRLDAEDRRSLRALTRAVRREVARGAEAGCNWRGVLDALRPHLQLLWAELGPADRRRFLRHLRRQWDVHRHRMAPPSAAVIETARADGRLVTLEGRIQSVVPAAGGEVLAAWRTRHGGELRELTVQRVIDCTGPWGDLAKIDDPLLQQLLSAGHARPDPCRLGFDATPASALIGGDGRPTPGLFGVGPVTRGVFWEITAIPEIRVQAEAVAEAALAAARRAAQARA